MKTEMRFGNNAVRTVAASLFAGLACLLILTGCPGTGSSHQGGGPVYTGGTAGSSESPASQAMNNINTGSINKLVELFTDGIGGTGTASTVPMDFPAEDLWLPEDATIKITMTVNGVTTVYTSTAVNGNFHFDLPAVVTGSFVSVRMDVIDSYGDLMCTGRASKTVQGATDTLELTLASTFRITVTPPAGVAAWCWMVNEDPSDPMFGWSSSIPGDYPDYSFSLEDEGKTAQIGGLAVKDGVIYEIPLQTITVGDVESVALTMNPALNFPGCVKLASRDEGGTATIGTTNVSVFSMLDRVMTDSFPAITVEAAAPCSITEPVTPQIYPATPVDGELAATSTLSFPIPADWVLSMNYVIKDYTGSVIGSGTISNDEN